MNKRPCYPSDRVCVVLCVSPIVSASCESGSESSSWPQHQLWQDVPPTRRADVCASVWVSAFRGVLLFVWEWGCMCIAFLVVSSHVHVSLPLWPPATFCISLWLLRLHPSPVRLNLRPHHILSACACTYEHMYCMSVCVCASECVHPSYIRKGHLNIPAILPRGNLICRLAPVWIMQAGWAVAKLCLRGEATQSQNTHTPAVPAWITAESDACYYLHTSIQQYMRTPTVHMFTFDALKIQIRTSHCQLTWIIPMKQLFKMNNYLLYVLF